MGEERRRRVASVGFLGVIFLSLLLSFIHSLFSLSLSLVCQSLLSHRLPFTSPFPSPFRPPSSPFFSFRRPSFALSLSLSYVHWHALFLSPQSPPRFALWQSRETTEVAAAQQRLQCRCSSQSGSRRQAQPTSPPPSTTMCVPRPRLVPPRSTSDKHAPAHAPRLTGEALTMAERKG